VPQDAGLFQIGLIDDRERHATSPARHKGMRTMRTIRLSLIAAAVGLASLAGGLVAPSSASAQDKIEIGYLPILPVAQLFIIEGEGWAEDEGLELDLISFQNGPAIVQALASGQLDVMYFGIGPAMVAKARGIEIKVVASNIVEQIGLIGRGRFAELMSELPPAEAVAKFTEETGSKPKIATFPSGSVPDTVLRHWIIRMAGLSPDDFEILSMGANQVQQALLSDAVDGASILEPILTVVLERAPDARVLVQGAEMFPDQPGAVVAVREEFLAENPEAIQKLVELHVRATALLTEDPAAAAPTVQKFVSGGLVPEAIILKALTAKTTNYMANPNNIIAATQVMHDFQQEIGTLSQTVPLDRLFDVRFYNNLSN